MKRSTPGNLAIEVVKTKSINYSSGGSLEIIDGNSLKHLAFTRFFYFTSIPVGAKVGGHAHKKCIQLFIPQAPGAQIRLTTNGGLNLVSDLTPGEFMVVHPWTWVEITFQSNNVPLLVAASEDFDEADYIRDWEEFLSENTQSDSR